MVVQNQRSGKMNQTTINDAYKKESREKACMFITRWMYEEAIPFNAVTYSSFQSMIEAIDQYGVGMKGPTLHEVRVTNIRKELTLTKRFDEKSYGGMEKKKNWMFNYVGWMDQ